MDLEKILAGISMNGNCTLSGLTQEELKITLAAVIARMPKEPESDPEVTTCEKV
jgi:hypothetical protein